MIRSVRIEREGRYEAHIPPNQSSDLLLLAKTYDSDHALYIYLCNQNSLLADNQI